MMRTLRLLSKKAVLLSLIFLIAGTSLQSYAKDYEDQIRVGLYYGSSARSSYNITGSRLLVYADGQLIWETGASALTLSKNSLVYASDQPQTSYASAISPEGMAYYDGSAYYSASSQGDLGYAAKTTGLLLEANTGESLILEGTLTIESADGIVGINGVKYRDSLDFYAEGSGIAAVNNIRTENYLKGVIAKEMPASWDLEALKAQAIVARNYVATNQGKHSSQGFNICATTHCQVYGGYGAETQRTNAAVEATSGELMYYKGRPAEGYFHSTSGGKTESSGNIWSASLPYLVGVEDSYSQGTPYDNWSVSITLGEIRALLANNGVNIGEVTGVGITKVTENDHALELTIYGSSGRHVLQKDRIRIFFGGERLKSTYFTLENASSRPGVTVPQAGTTLSSVFRALNAVMDAESQGNQNTNIATGNTVVFNGKGYGHGVGLSQYGAQNMAKLGNTYREILKHYFRGIDIY